MSARLAVRVTKAAERHIRRGHPWVFDSSITSVKGEGEPGDLAVVFDDRREFLAIGLYDPASPIRVRVLHHGEPRTIDQGWWEGRLRDAIALRAPLAATATDPDSATDGYRVVHGENDGFGGLVIDRYRSVFVAKVYSTAWFAHLPVLLDAFDVIAKEGGPGAPPDDPTLVLRLARSVAADAAERGMSDGTALRGTTPQAPVEFSENGLTFTADVVDGQKTGHFLDQRDNRRMVGDLAEGAEVLDVFSCTGGFSVHAAAGGSTSVTSVDMARPAIEAARRHMELNAGRAPVRRCSHHTTVGDAFDVMARFAEARRRFDVVVVDPPSFAQKRANAAGALRAYGRLTAASLQLVRPGGVLVQASCSSRVSADEFFDTVASAAEGRGATLHELARTGHGIDHPVSFREAAYLKALFARVEA